MRKTKVIMHVGYGNIGVAAIAAKEFVDKGYTSCMMEIGGCYFHIYYTKTGSVVVHENHQN